MAHFTVLPAAIVLGLPATLFVSTLVIRRNRPKSTFPVTVEALVAQGAMKAIARARSRYGLILDYTPESVRKVEIMLSNVYQAYREDPRLVDIDSMAFVLGSYIGETIRKGKSGARWEHSIAGDNCYALRRGSEVCFPMQWCMERLTAGESANVWTKYRMFLHEQVEEVTAPVRLKSLSASAGGYKF